MGWTYIPRKQFTTPAEQALSYYGIKPVEVSYYTALKYHGTPEREEGQVYAAVEADDSKVYGLVILVDIQDGKIGLKVIEESSGPVDANPAERVLNALSPVEELYEHPRWQEYANQWRRRAWSKWSAKGRTSKKVISMADYNRITLSDEMEEWL